MSVHYADKTIPVRLPDLDLSSLTSVLDTAYLSSLLNDHETIPVLFRTWLLKNRHKMSSNEYQFLCGLGLKKKSFINSLKRWIIEIDNRKRAIDENMGSPIESWLEFAGEQIVNHGGIFILESKLSESEPYLWKDELNTGIAVHCDSAKRNNDAASIRLIAKEPRCIEKLIKVLECSGIEAKVLRLGKLITNIRSIVAEVTVQDPNNNQNNIKLHRSTIPTLNRYLHL